MRPIRLAVLVLCRPPRWRGTPGRPVLDVFAADRCPRPARRGAAPVMSPHMAADASTEALREVFTENLRRSADGRPLRNVVDIRIGYVGSAPLVGTSRKAASADDRSRQHRSPRAQGNLYRDRRPAAGTDPRRQLRARRTDQRGATGRPPPNEPRPVRRRCKAAQEGLGQTRNRGRVRVELDDSDSKMLPRTARRRERAACTETNAGSHPPGRTSWKDLNNRAAHERRRRASTGRETPIHNPWRSRTEPTTNRISPRCRRKHVVLSAFDDRYIRPPTAVEEHQRLLDRLLGGDLSELLAEIDRHTNDAIISLSNARQNRDADESTGQ